MSPENLATEPQTVGLTEEQLDEIDKCRKDFYYWLTTYTKVVEVGKGTPHYVTWNIWEPQTLIVDLLLQGKWPLAPKARREGVTTINLYFGLWYIQRNPMMHGAVISETQEKAWQLLDWIRNIEMTQPDWMRLKRVKDGANYIQWDTKSQIRVSVGNEGAGRMAALNWCFIDEASYVPSLTAILLGVEPAAEQAGGIVSICSTTKREGTNPVSFAEFKAEANAAREGRSKFTACFLPWDLHPDRDEAWYEREAKAHAHIPGFMQREYPRTWEEAFGTIGGAVYPTLTKETHWGHFDPPPGVERYRAIDFGNSEKSAFVCLWFWHNPDSQPRLTFESDEDAQHIIVSDRARMKHANGFDEILAYRRDQKNERLIKENDNVADALRYGITMHRLRGHVHVYRCLFIRCDQDLQMNPLRMFELVTELSGMLCIDPSAGTWTNGPETEQYAGTVCDRAGTGWIRVLREKSGFASFGIDAAAYAKPETFTRDEREQGIVWVSALVIGGTNFCDTDYKTQRQVRIDELTSGERELTFSEKALLLRLGLSKSSSRKPIWGYGPVEKACAY